MKKISLLFLSIVIAVIDSSVDTSISELSESVIKKTSVLEKESYENVKHGTAVAGIDETIQNSTNS